MSFHHVRAVNTAPDSENRIHDDAVAGRYGFRGGLVPGVTVYGYMTIPVLEHFGEDWLERGAMSVRFREPVYEGEEISIEAGMPEPEAMEISLGNGRATGIARMEANPAAPALDAGNDALLPPETERPSASRATLAPGTRLGTLHATLDDTAARVTAPLSPWIGPQRLAHPAILLSLANQVLMRNVVLGPWIHVASDVVQYSSATAGDEVTVRARVLDRYERKGHEFVLLDVLTAAGERCIQQVRHTAIWKPRYTETSGAMA